MTKAYSRWGDRSKNVCTQFLGSQATGRKIKYHQIPTDIVQDTKHGKVFSSLWELFRQLDCVYFQSPFDATTVLDCLQSINRIVEDSDGTPMRFTEETKRGKDITISDIMHLQGGIEVIMRIFFHPEVRGKNETKNDDQDKIRMYCLDILHAACLAVENIALTIGKHDHLISYLFTIMEDRKTFLNASTLLEELLAVNRKIVDLSNIDNLQTLVSSLRDASFPGFCRILSTAVADIDFSDERSTLLAQDKEEKVRSQEKSLADKNQGLLLHHPDFLSRMVKLASKAFPGM